MIHISSTSAFENSGNIFMAARYTYIPTGMQADGRAWGIRKKVWKFKDGDTDTCSDVARWVAATLDAKMPDLENCTFVCIPASSAERTQTRYEQFAREVCEATQMTNAYDRITVEGERLAIHEHKVCKTLSTVQVLHFDREFFNGRKVIIFDDVITRGKTFATMVDWLEDMGAVVVGGIFLGATAHRHGNR